MSFSNLPLLRPTIKLKKTGRISYAIYAHIVSLIGGFFMVVAGLFNMFNTNFLSILGIFGGIFILVIEFDQYPVDFLKDPLNRGLVWLTIGFLSFTNEFLVIILTFVGAALYLVYHYQ